jgi:D-alanyl-D-alanine dipeptidase
MRKPHWFLSIMLLTLLPLCAFYFQETPQKLKIVKTKEEFLQQVAANDSMQMIDLMQFPALAFDIRYATSNNFMEQAIYVTPAAYCRKPLAYALLRANLVFINQGYRLKIYDAYRPYSATVKMFGLAKNKSYVASPSQGSRHNRGCAIDLTLVNAKTGEELAMPTPYDDFTERASPNYKALPQDVIKNRNLLIQTMKAHGFSVFHNEWWHYDFIGWERFPILDLPFSTFEP